MNILVLNIRALAVLGTILAAVAIMATTALAAKPTEKPGWGNGDTTTHTGPPGGGSTRPGVGTGDTNHTHTGAPGQ